VRVVGGRTALTGPLSPGSTCGGASCLGVRKEFRGTPLFAFSVASVTSVASVSQTSCARRDGMRVRFVAHVKRWPSWCSAVQEGRCDACGRTRAIGRLAELVLGGPRGWHDARGRTHGLHLGCHGWLCASRVFVHWRRCCAELTPSDGWPSWCSAVQEGPSSLRASPPLPLSSVFSVTSVSPTSCARRHHMRMRFSPAHRTIWPSWCSAVQEG